MGVIGKWDVHLKDFPKEIKRAGTLSVEQSGMILKLACENVQEFQDKAFFAVSYTTGARKIDIDLIRSADVSKVSANLQTKDPRM